MVLVIGLSSNAQSYFNPVPDDFSFVSVQFDPLGSIDKEGMNSVISFGRVDFGFVEYELQIQSIFTNKYSNYFQLYYVDVQFGVGPMITLTERLTYTPGIHAGAIYKRDSLNNLNHFFIYGATSKLRYWIGREKKFGLIVSCAYDNRRDIDTWIFNGRGGVTFNFN